MSRACGQRATRRRARVASGPTLFHPRYLLLGFRVNQRLRVAQRILHGPEVIAPQGVRCARPMLPSGCVLPLAFACRVACKPNTYKPTPKVKCRQYTGSTYIYIYIYIYTCAYGMGVVAQPEDVVTCDRRS